MFKSTDPKNNPEAGFYGKTRAKHEAFPYRNTEKYKTCLSRYERVKWSRRIT